MSKYKVLKHKTLEDTFGSPYALGNKFELWHIHTPQLYAQDVSIEKMKEYFKDHEMFMEQIEDYDLVEVELKYITDEDNKQV